MPAPAPAVQLTEKLLIAAGGWEVLRHARALRETGKVSGAQWSAPVLQGSVQGEGREYRSGLKILSQSNVENLCTCRPSREYGTICAHSVAVGLAILAGQQPPFRLANPPGLNRSGSTMAKGPAGPPVVTLPYQPDAGAEARLHVILAPDLVAVWSKGQLLVGLELVAGGKRVMFGTAGQGIAPKLLPEDFRVAEKLAQLIGAVPGGMQFVSREQFLEFLEVIAGNPRLMLGRSGALAVETIPLLPVLRASLLPDGALELAVQLPEDSRVLAAGGRSWLLRPGASRTVLQVVSPGMPAAYQTMFEQKSMRLPAAQADAFLNLEWPRLAAFFDLRANPLPKVGAPVASASNASAVTGVEPGIPQFVATIEGSLKQLGARLQAIYPNKRIVTVGITPERDTFTYQPPDAPAGTVHTRNTAAERDALSRFTEWDFTGRPDTSGHYFLRGEEPIVRFFALGLPAMQKLPNWQVTVGARFQQVSRDIEIITPEVAVRGSGEDWFEMEIELIGRSGERFPAGEIQRLLQMGAGHTRLRNGKLAVLPADTLHDLQEVLRDCDPSQSRPGVYKLDRSQGEYLEASLEKWGVATAPSWDQWRSRQGGLQRPAEWVLPPGLDGTMRPYQREGVRWLHLLAGNGLGGILADEMGLGKTLQALAYLASSGTGQPEKKAPSLVVCPTSLVENWRREAAKFTPGLKTLAIDGPDRVPLFAKIDAADLVITSYALLRRDLDRYRSRQFATVVLDEAHHIKNPDSQVAQAACALRSRQRFVLTGTPMENSVRDLWSILHFALPGYLGPRQDFRERYELPLSRPGEPTAAAVRERLTRRLRPVLLRRLKRDVAKDLPARIEQTAFCDLTAAQAQVYAQLLGQSRRKLDDARAEKNAGAGRMLVLTALLRLRQVCCDLRLLGLETPSDCRAGAPPAALGGDNSASGGTDANSKSVRQMAAGEAPALQPEDAAPVSSAKLAMLDELLEEIREGGHRVLIFSQFVSMLRLLSAHLEAGKIPFCYLDGSTKPRERTAQVERFQNDESVTAFLISVKAGGVGLNLTGADTVIHFDPWWNPAVEAQATDRAHRIGQTRVVTTYRLIARGTVEEKIFALQNRKRELTASLVEREKDEPLLETLSFEEIESLLE